MQLSLSQFCISSAMVLFHKYFLLSSHKISTTSDAKIYAAACLFIAIKTNFGFISVERLSSAFKTLVKFGEKEGKKLDKKLVKCELKVLSRIGFDLEIILPYKFLEIFFDYLRIILNDTEKIRNFLQTSNNFINDSFKIPLCLFYQPRLIALASVFLTAKLFNISLPDVEGLKWFNLVDESLGSVENLSEIANLMSNMYKIISVEIENGEKKDMNLKKLIKFKEETIGRL